MEYKFKKGDRVDYAFLSGRPNGTPGTVLRRVSADYPAYRVAWDDGYKDDPGDQGANIWPEDELTLCE